MLRKASEVPENEILGSLWINPDDQAKNVWTIVQDLELKYSFLCLYSIQSSPTHDGFFNCERQSSALAIRNVIKDNFLCFGHLKDLDIPSFLEESNL